MTTRYIRYVPTGDRDASVQAAKALARADGYRVRTVTRVVRLERAWRVELAVDEQEPTTEADGSTAGEAGSGSRNPPAPGRTSWVREARADAIAWRADHVAKGGS